MLPKILWKYGSRRMARCGHHAWPAARLARCRFPKKYATASGAGPSDADYDPDIDVVTMKRRSAAEPLKFPFRYDPVVSRLYDPAEVRSAAIFVTVNLTPGLDQVRVPQDLVDFVLAHCEQLAHVNDFICLSYSNKVRTIAQLTAVELANVLLIYRDLNRLGKLAHYTGNHDDVSDYWIEVLLLFLYERSKTAHAVPAIVGAVMSLIHSTPDPFVQMYANGLGKLLPELSTLAKDFDLTALPSVAPVTSKIAALVGEFQLFLNEHQHIQLFDADFFRGLISVQRYRNLEATLQYLEKHCGVRPQHLHQLINDPKAAKIQLAMDRKDQGIDKVIFEKDRDVFNLVYTMTGLTGLDSILAAVLHELSKPTYTPEIKQKLTEFATDYFDYACSGAINNDALADVKYTCLPLRYEGRVILPFKISDNVVDNYEFSLAMLLNLPDYFYLLRACQLPLKDADVAQIEQALRDESANWGSFAKADIDKLINALNEYAHHSVRGNLSFLDTLINDVRLLSAAEAQEVRSARVPHMCPEFQDLTKKTVTARENTMWKSVKINNADISTFVEELLQFKGIDLKGFLISALGYKNLLRYLQLRLSEVLSVDTADETSAINSENAANFAKLNELLLANFDIYGADTKFLDELVASSAPEISPVPYEQIPENLKIHMFTPELEALRKYEFKTDFRNLTADEVLSTLERRVNEVRKSSPGEVPAGSSINQENVVRYMKVLSRLKLLFSMNGGHTEILDAVLQSQSVLAKLESKLSAKRSTAEAQAKANELAAKAEAEKAASEAERVLAEAEKARKELYASGPYVQIPDNLNLHDYVEELKLFRHDDLRSSYKNFPPERILGLMGKRIKEIYSDLPCSNLALRMGKDNLVKFIQLHAKLTKLLAWNGGNTGILDTLILSQGVFEDFEQKVASKKEAKTAIVPESAYRQVPEDVFLEEYAEELLSLKTNLGSDFASALKDDIIVTLEKMIEKETTENQRLILAKLRRNLEVLFKHNNSLTFILDNVLLNAAVFENFERNKSDIEAGENKFVMSDFLDAEEQESGKYRDSEYVISLLGKHPDFVTEDANPLSTGASIHDVIVDAMSNEERKLVFEDPEEHAALKKLTASDIRNTYKSKSEKKNGEPLDKKSLESFLKQARKEKESKDEMKWREREAYEWSTHAYKGHRSLEARNFFNPMLSGARSTGFPMFPGSESDLEYLVLTPSGQTFYSLESPLGRRHVAEDMFEVLKRFPENELEKFSKNVRKLQKKNWRVISSGGTERMLILSRPKEHRKRTFVRRLKTILATTGAVFVTLIGLNWWIDDSPVEKDITENAPAQATTQPLIKALPFPTPQPQDELQPAVQQVEQKGDAPQASLWKKMLWK